MNGDFIASLGWGIDPLILGIAFAIIAVIAGVALGKIIKRAILWFGSQIDVKNRRGIQSFASLFEWFIFVIALIIALSFLGVDAANVVVQNIVSLLPPLISLILLLFLGFIFINLVIDLLVGALYKVGLNEYLSAVGLGKGVVTNIIMVLKLFLYLILLSSSLNYVGFSIPSLDIIVTGLIYAVIILGAALAFYVFKDPLTNFFSGVYIEKNLLKVGQRARVGDYDGEVLAITNHGTLLKLPTGFNVFIPNRRVLEEVISLKRARTEINKLEAVRSNFVSQLPSYCGPASIAMLLSFFGFRTTQEEVGRLCKAKVPGGTAPGKLVDAVKKFTGNTVTGQLIRYDEIYNLKDEVKSWISEGALIILWFKKPVVFPEKKSRSGHYVVCVGVEGDELIVMDPSPQTAGVYLVDYRLIEEAMADSYDRKTRGYIVFAKKGTSAFWRINHGLIYSDVAAYKDLSKSFERYLRKIVRKTATLQDVLAEPVSESLAQQPGKVRKIWAPPKIEKPAPKPAPAAKKEEKKK